MYIKLYKEMQTMKKILVVLMAMLTMAVMLAGCGGDSKKAAYPADGDISVIIPKAPDRKSVV